LAAGDVQSSSQSLQRVEKYFSELLPGQAQRSQRRMKDIAQLAVSNPMTDKSPGTVRPR
jgi:hypothetical protein